MQVIAGLFECSVLERNISRSYSAMQTEAAAQTTAQMAKTRKIRKHTTAWRIGALWSFFIKSKARHCKPSSEDRT
jgi:hypothetical protein